MYKTIKLCVLAATCVTIMSCVQEKYSEASSPYVSSAVVTNQIQAKLTERLGASSQGIKVRAYRDEVQLTGVVPNKNIRRLAGEIAADTPNLKLVRNDLMIQ